MYNKVDTNLNFVQREAEVLKFWKENDIAKKCIDIREGCDTFTLYDGPPTANGKPHIGHVLTRVIKDMLPRYQSMKGKKILRKAGWDTHGLPVELEVEKLLGLDGKEQIEKYGIEPFIKKCRESVWKYKGRCNACNTGKCPMGICTQDPRLVKRLDIDRGAQKIVDYVLAFDAELKKLMAPIGNSSLPIGRSDALVSTDKAIADKLGIQYVC